MWPIYKYNRIPLQQLQTNRTNFLTDVHKITGKSCNTSIFVYLSFEIYITDKQYNSKVDSDISISESTFYCNKNLTNQLSSNSIFVTQTAITKYIWSIDLYISTINTTTITKVLNDRCRKLPRLRNKNHPASAIL